MVGLARRRGKIEDLSRKLQNKAGELFPVKCDLTIESDIVKAIKWTTENLGPISILVNNAGVYRKVNLTSSPTDDFKHMWDVNVTGLMITTREVSRNMLENNIDGHIVHISSIASQGVYYPESGGYCSSKHAVKALTEALRLEFNSIGCQVKVTVRFIYMVNELNLIFYFYFRVSVPVLSILAY